VLTVPAVAILTAVPGKGSAASLTSISYTPNPIILGGGCSYTANDDGTWPVSTYKWEYRCTSGGTSAWVATSATGKTYFTYEPVPGNYEVRCTATFAQVGYNPPPGPSTVSVNVTIAPANTDHVVSGLNSPAGVGAGMVMPARQLILFEIMVGGTPVGPYVSGTLQERIRRPGLGFDSGWNNGNQDLYMSNGKVYDYKTVTLQPPSTMADYNAMPDGSTFDDFYQQFRIVTVDSCGNQTIMYLTEHHFTKIKSGSGQWSLVE